MALISVIDIWTTYAVTAYYQSSWSLNFVSYCDWNVMYKGPCIHKQVGLYTLSNRARNGKAVLFSEEPTQLYEMNQNHLSWLQIQKIRY